MDEIWAEHGRGFNKFVRGICENKKMSVTFMSNVTTAAQVYIFTLLISGRVG